MTVPTNFDWVAERLNCTAGIAFAQLRAGAESNVAARNESASNADRFKAAMNTTSNGTAFSVVRGRVRDHGYAEVKFTISRYDTGNEQIGSGSSSSLHEVPTLGGYEGDEAIRPRAIQA